MGIIPSMDAKRCSSFGDLAERYLQIMLKCFFNAGAVIDVVERYDIKNTITSAERLRGILTFVAQ